jgi:hypothetical protein
MIATVLRDQNLLKRNFRFIKNPKYKVLLDKQTILSEFEDTNKKIRADNHFASDNYYDNILNECLIDAANEILENERIYGQIGEPLPWSCRTRLINYKYIDNSVSKKNLTTKVRQEINNELNTKMGMFTENFENYEAEQLNYERERKLMNNITKEVF